MDWALSALVLWMCVQARSEYCAARGRRVEGNTDIGGYVEELSTTRQGGSSSLENFSEAVKRMEELHEGSVGYLCHKDFQPIKCIPKPNYSHWTFGKVCFLSFIIRPHVTEHWTRVGSSTGCEWDLSHPLPDQNDQKWITKIVDKID